MVVFDIRGHESSMDVYISKDLDDIKAVEEKFNERLAASNLDFEI